MRQFVPPDDEHDVLETCRELKIKINTLKGICASRWSFTKNQYMYFTSTVRSPIAKSHIRVNGGTDDADNEDELVCTSRSNESK